MADWQYTTPGIPDGNFCRSEGVPMTKEEIRALTISKLRLFPQAIIYDIGAGSGSVSIECAFFSPQGQIFAVEKEEKALDVIRKNIEHFGVNNIELIPGTAPEAIENLPLAHRIFIGGSGGNLEDILQAADRKLIPGGRLVINSVTLDTGAAAVKFMEKNGFKDIDITNLNVARAVRKGKVHLWQSRNPVQIVAGTKED